MNTPHHTTVSVSDFIAIQNIMGQYQWYVDEGKSEEWAALFLEDGVFDSAYVGAVRGHAELKKVPPANVVEAVYHLGSSTHMHYGAGTDEVWAKFYCLVTRWRPGQGGQFFCMALYTLQLLRVDGAWKIKLAKPEVL